MQDVETFTWPYIFDESSMDRSQSAHTTAGDSIPWVVGADGRHRGGLKTFDGFEHYDRLPAATGTGVITIYANGSLTAGTTITIGSVALTATAGAPGANQFQVGADAWATAQNLATVMATYTTYLSSVAASRYGTGTAFAWVKFTTNETDISFRVSSSGRGVFVDPAGSDPNLQCTSTGGMASFPSASVDALASNRLIRYMKYVEILKSGNSLLRGFVIVTANGYVFFAYKDGFDGNGFTGLYHIKGGATAVPTLATLSGMDFSVTYGGRCIYIVGSDGTNSFNKVVYYHPLYETLVTRDIGPSTATVGNNSHAGTDLLLYETAVTTDVLNHGRYTFGLRYYDPYRMRYTDLSTLLEADISGGGAHDPTKYLYGRWQMSDDFVPLGRDYTYAQIYSTISSQLRADNTAYPSGGFLFKRKQFALPASPAAGVTTFDYYAGSATAGDANDTLADDGLAVQDDIDPYSSVVNSTVPAMECIEFYQGTNFALVPNEGFLDIRWSPIDRIEPENFPSLNFKRTKIKTNGVAHFMPGGDFLWVLGDGESYRIQKTGSSMSIHRMLDGYRFVGKHSSVAVGSTLYAVTTVGLVAINANTGDVQHISSADRFILQRWVLNLSRMYISSTERRPRIITGYDGALGCVFIHNTVAGECLCLWLTTNRLTMLVGWWPQMVCTGWKPNERSGPQRLVAMTQQGISGSTIGGARFVVPVVSEQVSTTNSNMHGLPAQLSTTGYVTPSSSTSTTITVSTTASVSIGDLAGMVVYPEDGAFAGIPVCVTTNAASTGSAVTLTFESGACPNDATKLWVSPVVFGVMLPPLTSPHFPADMLSRRVTDSATTVVTRSNRNTSASTAATGANSTFGALTYGLSRPDDTGDNYIFPDMNTSGDYTWPTQGCVGGLGGIPWANTWTGYAAVGTTVPVNTPAMVSAQSDAGLYSELRGDGHLLFPSFSSFYGGNNLTVAGLYLFGRVAPSQMVATA